jgi:hypothetical protein
LNRTNRTLSAHLNRLNLGTRSLASLAGLNDGAQTLHNRHAYPVVMRVGVVGVPVHPIQIQIGRIGIPSIPSSPSVSSWLIESPAIQPRVDFAAFAFSRADWPARSFDRPCLRPEEPVSNPTRPRRERGKAVRKSLKDSRWSQGNGLAGRRKQATSGPVAAAVAAAGG